jgi:ABC-2 type transport system permease protein
VSQPATLTWLARHELRLFWRDWFSMLSAGRRRRELVIAAVAVVFLLLVHLMAFVIIVPLSDAGIAPDKATLVTITGSAFLSCTLMLSQAIESVTRAFYARGDLDLILSSPTSARRLFAVRMAAIALGTALLTTVLVSPFINVLAIYDGPRWLAGYGVLAAMGAVSTALAVAMTVVLFHSLGPRRTRLISQIMTTVVASAFVIGVQIAAILSTGGISRLSFFRSERVIALAPETGSVLWWPALAAMGNVPLLAVVLGTSLGLLALAITVFSVKFGDHVSAASIVADQGGKTRRRLKGFRPATTMRALRRKEWTLLRRDPWLLSQTLMQILYLLPPALILWRSFGDHVSALLVLVPILVMASGQLAGGLAWITVSGEDAQDLVSSAPIPARAIVSAKIEAVLAAVAVIVAPLVVALAIIAPRLAAVTALGIVVSALAGTMIQIWFRAQARRSNLRRRHIPSKITTLSEALSSILWAGTAALAAAGSWFAAATAVIALLALAGTWAIRPR